MSATEWELKNLKGIIYIIKNKINWKRYIGQTRKTFKKRYTCSNWWEAPNLNAHLSNSIKKYGIHNFDIEILMANKNKNELNYWEKFYIEYYNTCDERYGFNFRKGGEKCDKFSRKFRLACSLAKLDSLDEWIDKAKNIHGDKYDYSEAEIIPLNRKIRIKCKKCGIFFMQNRSSHLKGYGCKKCAVRSMNDGRVISFEEFLIRAKKKFGDEFEYFPETYKGIVSKTKILHKKCGTEFEVSAKGHLDAKHSCPYCCVIKRTRKIAKIDIKSGQIIETFDNVKDVFIKSNGVFKEVSLRYACNKDKFMYPDGIYKGFKWEYL